MSGHSGPSGPPGFTAFRTGTGTIPVSSDNSGGISVAGLTEPFTVVVTITGTGSAFGGSCQTGLNGCWYLNVVKSSGSFFVQLRNPVDASLVNAGAAIDFSYIAITNN